MAYYVELARVPLNAHEKPNSPQFIRLSCILAKEFASARKRHSKRHNTCLSQLLEKLSRVAQPSETELFKTISGEYHGSHSAPISDDQWLGTTIKPRVDQKPKPFFCNALKSPDKVDVGKMVEVRSNVYPCVAFYEWTKVPATRKSSKVDNALHSRFRVYFPFEQALKPELTGISNMLKCWGGKVTYGRPTHICALANQIKAKFPNMTSPASRIRDGELVVAKLDVARKFMYIDLNKLGPSGKTFGKGRDGHVFQTSWLGGTFARKEFEFENVFESESRIAARVSHPHVVHIFGSPLGDLKPVAATWDIKSSKEDVKPAAATWNVKPATQDSKPITATWGVKSFLLMEMLDEDLYHFLRIDRVEEQPKLKCAIRDDTAAWDPPLPLSDALEVLIQVAEGMAHLHARNVVHGDLKSKNILISAFELQKPHAWLYLVKVADLGQAQDLDRWPSEPFVPSPGTTWYAAPEVLEFRDPNKNKNKPIEHPKKIDVYSFGILAYEVLTGRSPYPDDKYVWALINKVLAGHRPSLHKLQAWKGERFRCPDALIRLLASCWDAAPDRRPTFATICKEIIDMKAQASATIKAQNGSSSKIMPEQYSSKLKSRLHNLLPSRRNARHHQFQVNGVGY